MLDMGANLMCFIAFYCFFDAWNLVFSGAIKGADTRFIMATIAALAFGVMIVPAYVLIEVFEAGIYAAWLVATIYVCSLGLSFMFRYRQGKWKSMRVLEHAVPPLIAKPTAPADGPIARGCSFISSADNFIWYIPFGLCIHEVSGFPL
jgi:hypothetical protein